MFKLIVSSTGNLKTHDHDLGGLLYIYLITTQFEISSYYPSVKISVEFVCSEVN